MCEVFLVKVQCGTNEPKVERLHTTQWIKASAKCINVKI